VAPFNDFICKINISKSKFFDGKCMKWKIILAILLIFILIACNEDQNIKKLNILSTLDYLKDSNGDEVFLDDISEVLQYGKDSLLIVSNFDRNIYLTTFDFKILKTISLKEKAYLFKGNIFSATLIENLLYIVDNSFNNIKILNMKNDSISILNYETDKNYPSAIQNIITVNDSILFCSYSQVHFDKNECLFGAMYNTNGKIIRKITLPVANFDYNEFILNDYPRDGSFVAKSNKSVYFSFSTARNIFEYDFTGKMLNTYSLDIDKQTYQPPHVDKIGNYIDRITSHPLEIVDNRIYYVLKHGEGFSPTILEYTLTFKKITEYVFDQDIIRGWAFLLKRFDNRFIIKDIPGPLFYVAKIE
jgi:hypothetical protein